MENNREKIKNEILELFGEKVYYIFKNNQGTPNDSEFLESLTFQEVIALNNESSRGSIKELISEYEELNIYNTVDFLESFQKFIKTYYEKNENITEIEENFGNERYKELIKEKSIEIFNENKRLCSEIMLNKLMKSKELTEIFKNSFCEGNDLSSFSNKELKSKLDLFSKANIINSLDKVYKSLRSEPLIKSTLLFDNQRLFESILLEVKL